MRALWSRAQEGLSCRCPTGTAQVSTSSAVHEYLAHWMPGSGEVIPLHTQNRETSSDVMWSEGRQTRKTV